MKFSPVAGYNGNVIFDYTAKDNNGATSNIATYTIPVTGLTPQANNVTTTALSVSSGQSPVASLAAIETGGTIATYTINSLPSAASGVLYLCTPGCVPVTLGQVITAANAANLSFTPSATFNGIYTQFNYSANDATGILSNVATFTIPLTVGAALPVHLVNFNAEKRTADVKLIWTTENEINSNSFVVERSLNGVDFSAIGNVQATGSQGSSAYNMIDNLQNVTSTIIYYRLKMIDKDGQFNYSAIVTVKLDGKIKKGVAVTPNPVRTTLQLTVNSDINATATIKITTILGEALYQSQKAVFKGSNLIPVDNLSSKLANGTYIVRTVIGGETFTTKFILQR